MPHQCVRCNSFFEDGADELLKGCSCGGKLFFYIRRERFEAAQKQNTDTISLSDEQKNQIEQDVLDIVGKKDIDVNAPVILDLESVRVVSPGQYELDLVHLFRGDPLIFKLEEGKYMIDVVESFKKLRAKK